MDVADRKPHPSIAEFLRDRIARTDERGSALLLAGTLAGSGGGVLFGLGVAARGAGNDTATEFVGGLMFSGLSAVVGGLVIGVATSGPFPTDQLQAQVAQVVEAGESHDVVVLTDGPDREVTLSLASAPPGMPKLELRVPKHVSAKRPVCVEVSVADAENSHEVPIGSYEVPAGGLVADQTRRSIVPAAGSKPTTGCEIDSKTPVKRYSVDVGLGR